MVPEVARHRARQVEDPGPGRPGVHERRAAAVLDYLVKNGITDRSRITTVGRGESQPVAGNATRAGRFQNRRVEILVLP